MSIDNLFKVSLASKLIDKEVSYHLLRQALRLGLSALELQVLWVVYSSGELVMLDIAAATGYGTQELQPIIEALEAEGLVTEVCFCDSHKRVIAISEKGKNKIRKISDNEGLKFCFTSVKQETASSFIRSANSLASALRGYGIPKIIFDGKPLKTQRQSS